MTHPLYQAIDAAIAEHGWPDDAKCIVVYPALEMPCSVTLGKFGRPNDDRTAMGATLAEAASKAASIGMTEVIRFLPNYVGKAA